MEIRDLNIDDIPQLALLYKQFWNEDSDIKKMQEQFSRLAQNSAYILLGAINGNVLVGSIMGIVCEELYGNCKPFLVVENMVVDSNVRKKGIGKALFTEMERNAREKECTQIILVTEANRLDACAFYETMGFHPTTNRGYKKKL